MIIRKIDPKAMNEFGLTIHPIQQHQAGLITCQNLEMKTETGKQEQPCLEQHKFLGWSTQAEGRGWNLAPLWAAMLALSGFWQKLWMSARLASLLRPSQHSRATQPRKWESRWHVIHSYFLNVTQQTVQSLDPLGQKDWNWGSGGEMVINWQKRSLQTVHYPKQCSEQSHQLQRSCRSKNCRLNLRLITL